MFDQLWSFLGWQADPASGVGPARVPPPATITGVRIPADGAPIHLLRLTTTPVSGKSDCFLFHAPDLRRYWRTETAWNQRDLQRFEISGQQQPSCNGVYYVFYSYSTDGMPENKAMPRWLATAVKANFRGDVFMVKMTPAEFGQYAWAEYEDVAPEFVDLMVHGPSARRY